MMPMAGVDRWLKGWR